MIRVLFFGGYASTPAQVTAWMHGAQKQRPDVEFLAWSYPPGAGADRQDALNGFGNDRFDQIVSLIRSHPDDEHVIVGHSSGCAIADAVAEGLGDPPVPDFKARLVVLDGFTPDRPISIPVEYWSARCGTARSRNWKALCDLPDFHAYWADNAYTPWALHFSLINVNVPPYLEDLNHGYDDCRANLCWLEDEKANWVA